MHIDRDSCGKTLRDARKRFGVESPARLSELMRGKYSVSGILKRERGEIKIDLEYINDFCSALRISGKEKVRLVELAKLFLLQFDPWQQSGTRERLKKLQLDFWTRLLASDRMFEYELAVICGMLQCEDYRYEILRAHGAEHSLAVSAAKERAQMAQTLLKSRQSKYRGAVEGPQNIQLVTHENALYMPIGSKKALIKQLDYLLSLDFGRGLEHRILPAGQVIPNFPLMYSFTILDGSLILMEAATGAVYSASSDSADWLHLGAEAIFERAVSGKQCRTIVERALKYHR